MWNRVIVSGVRLLIAAALYSLLTMPAAAHPRHDNDAAALITVAALDTLADQATADDVGRGEREIAASAALGCCCCCGPSDCSTGCAYGMASGSGSCGHAGGALASSHGVSVAPSVRAVHDSRSDQLLAGEDQCPGDRPPAV